jgi:hypothetical protein
MEAGAELQQIADRQPDEQRQGRNHLEIDDRPQSDAIWRCSSTSPS